jgi:hypothetical protein
MKSLTRVSTLYFSALIAVSGVMYAQAQTLAQIAAAMVNGLQGPPGSQAYSKTVEQSVGKGFMQLDAVPYTVAGAKNGGLEQPFWQLWHNELHRLGLSYGDMAGIIAIKATPGLLDSEGVRREVAERYFARLKLLSPESLQKWHEALSRITPNVSDLVLVHLIVAHDPLFDGSELAAGRAERELGRLQSLPAASVTTWGEAAGYPVIDAAFSLLKVESLFNGQTFQQSAFDAALPVARQRLK